MEKSPDVFLALSDADKKALADPSGRFGSHLPDEGFLGTFAKGREVSMHPAVFAEMIKSNNFSLGTNKSDKETVSGLFAKVATTVLGSLQTANFSGIEWTPLAEQGGLLEICGIPSKGIQPVLLTPFQFPSTLCASLVERSQ
eukprot:2398323-Rhodomonas_salina.1